MAAKMESRTHPITRPYRPALLAVLIAWMLLGTPQWAAAQETPLLDYGIDVVSSYVTRGQDLFVGAYDKEGEEHPVFPIKPAAQPYLTFYGPAGFTLELWGSWALVERNPESVGGVQTFNGLREFDEIDYTLRWSGENRLWAMSAGWALYTNPTIPHQSAANELFFTLSPKVLEDIGGTLEHYVVPDAGAGAGGGATYTMIGIGGEGDVSWGFSVGHSVKVQDVTGNVGFAMGDFSITLNGTYRPNPELVGYNEAGTYQAGLVTEEYPKTIFWITLSYGGSVAQ